MRRVSLLTLLLLVVCCVFCITVTGCSNLPAAAPQNPTPGVYYSLWGLNQAPRMTPGDPYKIPNDPGLVGYVQTAWNGKGATIATVMTLKPTIAGAEYITATVADPYSVSDVDPPAIRLFIELPHDHFLDPDMRWWCTANKFDILADGTFSVSCPLDWRLWTDVDGQHIENLDPANMTPAQIAAAQDEFEAQALSQSLYGGWTFGGQDFAGHGISCTGDNVCTFTLDSFTVE
jgi:hypothetical protein